MNSITFGRDTTKILKGIALLMMLVHHTGTPSYWAAEGTAWYSFFAWQTAATKMCVWIFAFLVGYGFFCSANKTVHYSVKRILMLLVPFWTMMALMFIPLYFFAGDGHNLLEYNIMHNEIEGGGKGLVTEMVYNLFGISESLNWYSWFVFFYILAILCLPFLHRLYMRYARVGWLLSILLFYGISVVIHTAMPWDSCPVLQNVFTFTTLVPVVIVGYMCAFWNRQGLLPRWFEGKDKRALSWLVVFGVLGIEALKIPAKGFCIQAFYTPFLIFALVGLFNSHAMNRTGRFLQKVGDLSMYMWFFHAVFFTEAVNLYTKDLVMAPFHSYPYTLLMTFVLTYAGSWCFKKLLTPVMNKIK